MGNKKFEFKFTNENICLSIVILFLLAFITLLVTSPGYSEERVNFYKDDSILLENNSRILEIDKGIEVLNDEPTYDIKIFYSNSTEEFFNRAMTIAQDGELTINDFNETHYVLDYRNFVVTNTVETFSDKNQYAEVYIYKYIIPKNSYDKNFKKIKENTPGLVIMGADYSYTEHVFESLEFGGG